MKIEGDKQDVLISTQLIKQCAHMIYRQEALHLGYKNITISRHQHHHSPGKLSVPAVSSMQSKTKNWTDGHLAL